MNENNAWKPVGTGFTVADSSSVSTLPAGMYSLESMPMGGMHVHSRPLRADRLVTFSEEQHQQLQNEVDLFWDSRAHYQSLGVTHKRGILLHGLPGCGKTAITALAAKNVIDRGGIVVSDTHVVHLSNYLPDVLERERDREFVVLLEDIDELAGCSNEKTLLGVLDGSTNYPASILFVATTNYLQRLPKRIRCRPSRFDTVLEIGLPGETARSEYVRFLLSEMPNVDVTDEEIASWVAGSAGLSLAAVKEMVLALVIFRQDLETVLARLHDLEETDRKPSTLTRSTLAAG